MREKSQLCRCICQPIKYIEMAVSFKLPDDLQPTSCWHCFCNRPICKHTTSRSVQNWSFYRHVHEKGQWIASDIWSWFGKNRFDSLQFRRQSFLKPIFKRKSIRRCRKIFGAGIVVWTKHDRFQQVNLIF